MNTLEALNNRRTIRLFQQTPIGDSMLEELINAGRLAPSAANLQQLRYIVVRTPDLVKQVFACTAWAALVHPRRTPQWGETAPAAFIAVIAPASPAPILHFDAGAALQNMQLAAWNNGIGACCLGKIEREPLRELLQLPENKQVLYLLALGYPAEFPVQEDIDGSDSVSYYLDEQNRLHIPKIRPEDLATWM